MTDIISSLCVKSIHIWSFSGPNAGKYGPEKLQIRTLFTQCQFLSYREKAIVGYKVSYSFNFLLGVNYLSPLHLIMHSTQSSRSCIVVFIIFLFYHKFAVSLKILFYGNRILFKKDFKYFFLFFANQIYWLSIKLHFMLNWFNYQTDIT